MTLIEQILEGARDQMRSGRIEDALGLLETAVSLQQQAGADSTTARSIQGLLRELAALAEAGTRFWAGWAQLVAPDVGLYTATGDLAFSGVAAPPRLALLG